MSFSFEEEIVKLPKKRKKLANEVGCLLCPLSKYSPISLSKITSQPLPQKHTSIYILGETPNDFIGLSGNLIQSTLTKVFYPNDFTNTVKYGSILKCNTDDITDLEIDCCKNLVEKEIEESHPLVIIGLGDRVLKWMLGLSSFEVWRGRTATVKINDWVCFFIPTYSSSYLSSLKESFFKEDAIKFFHRDIIRAIYTGINDSPDYIDKDFTEGVLIINKTSTNPIAKIRTKLDRFKDLPEIALDIETTGLSPYKQDVKILSIAIGTTTETIAFPLEHEGFWEEQDLIEVKKILKDFILNSSTKICHNLKFDLSFLVQMFGNSIVKETQWGDTMLLAYAINEKNVKMKEGPLSLNSLCEMEFGLKLKKLTELDKTALKDAPLDTLLTYNALDTKYTHKLYKALRKKIEPTPTLVEVYKMLVKTTGTLLLTEEKGITIDLEKVEMYRKEIQDKIKNIDAELKEDQGIKLYEKQLGVFNPSSNEQIGVLLKDILKLPKLKGTETDDSYSTDKDTLELYGEMGVSCAKLLSDRRAFVKLNSTYLDPIPTLLDKDGKLRTSFSLAFTATGRISSAAPNLQNIPRRSANYIRNIVVPPHDNYYFLACDLGQIEARLIAIASQDKEFCKAIREGYDIHKHWAIEICKVYPKACGVADVSELKDKKLKQFRDRVKNEFVFPAFYGSSKNSIGKSLEIPEPEITKIFDMFWNMFPGVKNWQKENNTFYAKNGYTETLTGRRRHGPMSYTKIVNTPIQSLAADLILDSMNRISDIAYKTNNPDLQPILQIHDDLSFYINKNSLDSSMEVIAKEMCRLPWIFINIPLTVEIKIGKSWGELEEVAVFSTNDFKY